MLGQSGLGSIAVLVVGDLVQLASLGSISHGAGQLRLEGDGGLLAVNDGVHDPSVQLLRLAVALLLGSAVQESELVGGSAVITDDDGSHSIAAVIDGVDAVSGSFACGERSNLSFLQDLCDAVNVDADVLDAGGDVLDIVDHHVALHLVNVDGDVGGVGIAIEEVVLHGSICASGNRSGLLSGVLAVDGHNDIVAGNIAVIVELLGSQLQTIGILVLHSVLEPQVHITLTAVSPTIIDGITVCVGLFEGLLQVDLDGLLSAVSEDSAGVSQLAGQVRAVLLISGDEHILIIAVNLLDTDQVAVRIEVQVVGGVIQIVLVVSGQNIVAQRIGSLTGLGKIILGLAGHDVSVNVLAGELVQLNVLHGLSGGDGLDFAVSDGQQDHVAVLVVLDGSDVVQLNVIHGTVAIDLVELQGFLLLVVIVGLSQIGVDLNDGQILVVVVHEDLGQNALAGTAHLVVVLLGDLRGLSLDLLGIRLLDAVHPVGQIIVSSGRADVGIDVAALDLGGVLRNQQVIVDIGADVLLVVGPLAGGTAEVVGIVGADQLLEVLLAELDIAVLLDLAVVQGALVPGQVLADAGDGNSGAALADNDAVVILDHGSLQGVEGIQASLFTVDSLGAVEAALQAVVQAGVDGLLGNSDGPVGAGVALDGRVIAQSAQQHLHESIAGQGVAGLEGAVSVTGDDAFLLAVSDVASEGAVGGNVLVRSRVGHQSGGGGGAKDQVADDLGGSATGQGVGGTEVTFGIAVDDLCGGHHGNGFIISDLVVVGEVLGTSRDGDQRHGHHQSQYQRKELLHGVSSLIKCRNIALELPAPGFRVSCRG